MQKIDLKDLLNKYRTGECSQEELALLENWYLQWKTTGKPLSVETLENLKAEAWAMQPIHEEVRYISTRWINIAAAAIVVFCLGFILYFYQNNKTHTHQVSTKSKSDFSPGKSTATLTLSDGKKVILSEVLSGELAVQAGVQISKTSDGQLLYTLKSDNTGRNPGFNTLSTANGEQYQLILPDGTKVWLNAASSLTYPVSFGNKFRKVKLSGEAYFEVAKDEKHRFIVEANKQRVEVLGTRFNVNSYLNEPAVVTTLLEGSLRVELNTKDNTSIYQVVLKPGQKSVVMNRKIQVAEGDTEEAIAWKNSLFIFSNENLESIMRKISRWYNVEVIYQHENLKEEAFWGSVSRFENASEVLKMLEVTGAARFKIENNKIFVTKKP